MLSKVQNVPAWLADGAERNVGTLWQVVKAYRANQRQGTVGVKTRGMVTATGKKPYKQKKTGSARRGSFVANLHRGGGVSHGPKMRDYRESIPKQMASVALKIALAQRVKAGKVFSGQVDVASGKTKDAANLLKGIQEKAGKTIVCLSNPSESTLRAFRSIRGVVLVTPEQVNAFDIVQARALVASQDALKIIENRFAATSA
jgi:large subunit ribosomal protein L4